MMRLMTNLCMAVILILSLPGLALAGGGDLDTTFGTNGIVLTNIYDFYDNGSSVVIQSDGKVLVGGYTGNPRAFALIRYNSDGTLDTGFGTNGIVTTDLGGSNDGINCVAVLADGKILAAGKGGSGNDFGLARYNSDGTLDTGFGTNGIVTTDLGGSDSASDLRVQSDGKIVLGGKGGATVNAHLLRYNSDGTLDTGFGTNGIVTTDLGGSSDEFRSIAIQPDGKLVVAGLGVGVSSIDFVIARYNSDGTLDTGFGTNGLVKIDFLGGSDYAYAVTVQSDNKIVAAGSAYKPTTPKDNLVALVRLNSDGTLDSGFGTNGQVSTQFAGGSYTYIRKMFYQADGGLLVAGYSNHDGDNDYVLGRFLSDGSLDSSFGTNGSVFADFGYGADNAYGADYSASGGIVVLTGSAKGTADNDFGTARFSVLSGPANPDTVTETGGAADDTWQSSVSDPAFTWSGATDGDGSGIAEYGVYWGTASDGTDTVTTTLESYDPASPGEGTYYLRLNTVNNSDGESGWETAFTFKYDGTPPANPTTITETAHSVADTGWSSFTDPAFEWNAAADGTGSGAGQYDVYWGTASDGTTAVMTTTSTTYTPAALSADGDYYLRLRTTDNAGNASAWETAFTYRHETAAPTAPTVFTETNSVSSGVMTGVSTPAFAWSGATDSDSGVQDYDVYWGPNSSGTDVISSTAGAAYAPPELSTSGTFYLRVRTTDNAGNSSAWTDGFTYVYDNTSPTNPTTITETHSITDSTWQNTVYAPAFTWSGATDGGNASGVQDYDVYWGTSSSGTTVAETVTTAAYTPTALLSASEGIYYLRLRTRSGTGAVSAWMTAFTFQYDGKAPVGPTSATETGGAQSGVWKNTTTAPDFTWSAATDSGSGVAYYEIGWSDQTDTHSSTMTTTLTSKSDLPLEEGYDAGIVYLYLRAHDNAGNAGNWANAFIFKYDGENPTAPTSTLETHSVISGTWQSAVDTPSFTWSGAADGAGSGIKEYDVYWGIASDGTTVTNRVSTAAYTPGQSSGTYYLRARTRDNVSRESAWVTLFTFHHADAPTNPTTITETHSITDSTWQNTVNAPAFTWSGATDGGNGSGVKNYDVYWGTASDGTTVAETVTAAAYTPISVADGTYYLRLRTRNNDDMVSGWETAFTFKYDSAPPFILANIAEGGGAQGDTWQNSVSDPTFTWSVPSDNLSGIDKYNIYWGISSTGTSTASVTSPAYNPEAVSSGTYYLRGRAVDRAGNTGNWQSMFTFKYDSSAPTLTLDAPTTYPATLDFTVRWQAEDDESGPDTCTVERQTGGLHSYLANNQPYDSVKSGQHFENISGVTVVFTATCNNVAGLTTVVTDSTLIAPSLPDADSDEMPDEFETLYGLNPNSATDASGDLDSDELTNLQEYQYGTDPTDVDSDGDGLSDYDEINTLWGSSIAVAEIVIQAESTDPVDWDSDGDGFSDGREVSNGDDPLDPDDPYDLAIDTDGDGMPDGWETAYGLDPNDNSDAVSNTDGDGLDALGEFNARSDPGQADTDNDGISDSDEVNTHGTDPTRWDSDTDGWGDGDEISKGTDPTDGNSSPTLDDSDGDGMLDSWEDDNGLDSGTDDADADPDNDGLTNQEEYGYSTDPNDDDSDDDGFSDHAEIQAGSDPNNQFSTPENADGDVYYLPLIYKND